MGGNLVTFIPVASKLLISQEVGFGCVLSAKKTILAGTG